MELPSFSWMEGTTVIQLKLEHPIYAAFSQSS
jgi:hypothetical protein